MSRLPAALLGCVLTLGAASAAENTPTAAELPDMGGPAYVGLTKADEYQIGRMEQREIRDQNLILDDAEVTDYLQQLGLRLASQAGADGQNFQYLALNEPSINAFATFGGFVYVHSGLILLTTSEAQLASVMAHETGHVLQRHMARAVQAESRMSLASTAAMLAGILIAAASGAGGQAMEGAMAMSQAVALQQSINFTRSQEVEADAVGINLLARAGFDPLAMPAFFESLSRSEGLAEGEIPALLQDHPVTSERIATSRARAAAYVNVSGALRTAGPLELPGSQSFDFMRERVRVLTAPPEASILQYYSNLRERRSLTPSERYGEALAQTRAGNPRTAVRTLRELQADYPHLTMIYGTLGQALAAAGQPDAALAYFEHSMKLFPRNVPLTVRYAETLMQVDKPRQAHELLLDLFNNIDPNPAQIRLTALAASAAGDVGDAYYYMCEYDLSGGNLALASQQLELALASPNLTNVQRQRFRARLEQVRGWLREQMQQRQGGR